MPGARQGVLAARSLRGRQELLHVCLDARQLALCGHPQAIGGAQRDEGAGVKGGGMGVGVAEHLEVFNVAGGRVAWEGGCQETGSGRSGRVWRRQRQVQLWGQ